MANFLFINRIVGAIPPSFLASVSGLQFRHPWLRTVIQGLVGTMRGRDGVIQQGIGRGLRFNTTANLGYLLGTSEPDVQASLAMLATRGSVFYDIGANVGFTAVLAARLVGPHGHVVCFEPVEENVRQVMHNVKLNGFSHVLAKRTALANQEGTTRFAVSSTSTLGRIVDATAKPNPVDMLGYVEVAVSRLDDLVSREKLPAPSLIKIDVEGSEGDVLAGAERILSENRPILLIELHGTNEPVNRILLEAGYRLCVLGSTEPVIGAHWNSHIVGIPEERPDCASLISRLTAPTLAEEALSSSAR